MPGHGDVAQPADGAAVDQRLGLPERHHLGEIEIHRGGKRAGLPQHRGGPRKVGGHRLFDEHRLAAHERRDRDLGLQLAAAPRSPPRRCRAARSSAPSRRRLRECPTGAPAPPCAPRPSPRAPPPGSANPPGTPAIAPRARSCSRQSLSGSRTLPARPQSAGNLVGPQAPVKRRWFGQQSTRIAAGGTVRAISGVFRLAAIRRERRDDRRPPRIAVLVMVVAALGLPVNDLVRYAVLLFGAIAIFSGAICLDLRRWFAALAVIAVAVAGTVLWPAPRIDEGHNIFVLDSAQPDSAQPSALERVLPEGAYRLMAAEFEARHPRARRCTSSSTGCWESQAPVRGYAFSADAIHGGAAYSRRVTGIDFSDPVWLRLGAINEGHNWGSGNDLQRNKREPRWKLLHPWRLDMPYFVMVRMPAAFAGSRMCWQGLLLWERDAGRFEPLRSAERNCRTVEASRYGPDDLRRRDLKSAANASRAELDGPVARIAGGRSDVGGGACRRAAAGSPAATADDPAVGAHRSRPAGRVRA